MANAKAKVAVLAHIIHESGPRDEFLSLREDARQEKNLVERRR